MNTAHGSRNMQRSLLRTLPAAAFLAALALLPAPGRGPLMAAEKTEAALMDADRAFAVAAATDGLEGWMSYFADDAVKFAFKGPLALGKDAVRAIDAQVFADPAILLKWQPTDAWIYADTKTGLTRGNYQVVTNGDGGEQKILSTGVYLTLWRHQDGAWKVILDTGQPDAPAGGQAAAASPDHDHNQKQDHPGDH